MIYKRGVDIQFAERELHLREFVNIHLCGELTHRDWKEGRSHRLGHNLAEGRPGAVKTEDANCIFGIVRRLEEGEALNVVPVCMGDQQREFDRPGLKFFLQCHTKRPDAGARIEHDNFALCTQLDAGGIATVTQSVWAWHSYRATCSPELDSCRG